MSAGDVVRPLKKRRNDIGNVTADNVAWCCAVRVFAIAVRTLATGTPCMDAHGTHRQKLTLDTIDHWADAAMRHPGRPEMWKTVAHERLAASSLCVDHQIVRGWPVRFEAASFSHPIDWLEAEWVAGNQRIVAKLCDMWADTLGPSDVTFGDTLLSVSVDVGLHSRDDVVAHVVSLHPSRRIGGTYMMVCPKAVADWMDTVTDGGHSVRYDGLHPDVARVALGLWDPDSNTPMEYGFEAVAAARLIVNNDTARATTSQILRAS